MRYAVSVLILLASASAFAAAQPKGPAKPFGIEIGVHTCAVAQAILSAKGSLAPNGDFEVKASRPSQLYPSAISVVAVCASVDEPVVALTVTAPRNRFTHDDFQHAFLTLSEKYSAVGRPVRNVNLSNGALFTDSTQRNLIKLGLDWPDDLLYPVTQFTVKYMTKAVYERVELRARQALDKEKADAAIRERDDPRNRL